MSEGSTGAQEKQSTAYAGVDSSKPYDFIGNQNIAYGQNISLRGGKVKSRPRIIPLFTLPTGLFQGGSYCDLKERQELLFSVSGGIYAIDPVNQTVRSIMSSVDSTALLYGNNDPRVPRVYFEQTPSGVVVQDGQSHAVVYDGVSASRSATIPIGTRMKYCNGRLAVAFGPYVRIGDIYDANTAKSEWKFEETTEADGGGDFYFGQDVKTLGVLPSLDSTQGQGPLIVGTSRKVSTLRLDIPTRSNWASTEKFQSIIFDSFGMTGQNACSPVNQDIFFRSTDGIRSMRRAYSGSDSVNLPVSSPVESLIGIDDLTLLDDCSSVFFDNRLLVLNGPHHYATRAFYTGITSLNLEIVRQDGSDAPVEAFEGEWNSYRFLQLLKGIFGGRERCFAVGLDDNGNAVLYEILREKDYKNDLEDEENTPIHSFETRAFLGTGIDFLKRISSLEVYLTDIKTDTKLNVYYRPDNYPGWYPWQTFNVISFIGGDALANTRIYPQSREPLRATEPVQANNTLRGIPPVFGYKFQLRFDWIGDATFDKFILGTNQVAETVFAPGSYETGEAEVTLNPRKYWYLADSIALSDDFVDGISFYNPIDDSGGTENKTNTDDTSKEDDILEGTEGTCYRTILEKEIVLRVNPLSTWSSYVISETVPDGLTVSSITGGGVWDETTRTITWTNSTTATAEATFRYSVDGADGEYTFYGIITPEVS